jgi:hypothetical protein
MVTHMLYYCLGDILNTTTTYAGEIMRPETLAEKLQQWLQAIDEQNDATQRQAILAVDVCTNHDIFTTKDAKLYLRGYDDAKDEMDALGRADEAVGEMQAEIDRLTAHVQELETTMLTEHSQLAQKEAQPQLSVTLTDEMCEAAREAFANSTAKDFYSHWRAALQAALGAAQQPAAVGVAGSVRWGVMTNMGVFDVPVAFSTRAQAEARASHGERVVAIVDPEQIVPLASAEVVGVASPSGSLFAPDKLNKPGWSDCAPVYRGLAQPALERDA